METLTFHLPKEMLVKKMVTGLAHVGIAVNNLNEALAIYEKILGLQLVKIGTAEEQGIKVAVLLAGETKVELLEPTSQESSVAKFITKKGEGIHHIAFTVSDIEKSLEEIKQKGIALIDEKPRIGFEGHRIAFLHPKSIKSVLVELCEK